MPSTLSSRVVVAPVALLLLLFLLLLSVPTPAHAIGFYLPGISPKDYNAGDEVAVKVNSLRSLSQVIPYDYYKGPFCRPRTIISNPQSLGEIIWGDHVQSSLYKVRMLKNESCVLLQCPPGSDELLQSPQQIDQFAKMINDGYRGHMSIDNLPLYNPGVPILMGQCRGQVPLQQTYPYQRGYALGVHKNCVGSTLVNNHIHYTIKYHAVDAADAVAAGSTTKPTGKQMYRVVGLTGVPYSIKHNKDGGDCNLNSLFNKDAADNTYLQVDDLRDGKTKVWWSYSVTWVEEPNVFWSNRWDPYLSTSVADSNATIHWVYIITSLMVTVCLAFVTTIVLMRTLHKDFNRYNSPNPDDNQEEIGWKLVHADVFRPPPHAKLLSALTGSGVQITLMCVFVLFFALLGFLSPASRGMLLTAIILMYVLLSVGAGYVCGKLLVMFDQREWRSVFICAMLFPGVVFSSYLITDIINYHAGGSDAVPFLTLLTLFALWIGVSIPLTVLGASFAFHQPPLEPAAKVGRLAREIPTQRWYHSAPFIYLVPALAPLAAAFLEIKFILSSFWQGMVYYVFGFLTIVFIVWVATVVLTTIVVIYYMLCYENWRWWWPSFIIPGGCGIHLVVFSIYYYFTQLDIRGVSGTMIYFIYMFLFSAAYGIVSGTLGFIASLFFTRVIYSSIKLD